MITIFRCCDSLKTFKRKLRDVGVTLNSRVS